MNEKLKVGLVMKSLQADFFKIMEKGARDYAEQHPDIELITVGTPSQVEVDYQVELVDQLITQRVDAIVIVPIDSKALVPPVIRAVLSGIKVVNIDIRLDKRLLKDQNIQVAYIGPDDESAAYDSGKVLASYLNANDNVVIIEGLRGADNACRRNKGFLRAIREKHLNLVASEPADWETYKAEAVFNKFLLQYTGIKGVFCGNDAMALGVINVMDRLHISDMKVCGFDNDPSAQKFFKERKQVATVDIYSSQMAVEGMKCAIKMCREIFFEAEIVTKYKLYNI
jgi:ribose transport system substrate-binding protein